MTGESDCRATPNLATALAFDNIMPTASKSRIFYVQSVVVASVRCTT